MWTKYFRMEYTDVINNMYYIFNVSMCTCTSWLIFPRKMTVVLASTD